MDKRRAIAFSLLVATVGTLLTPEAALAYGGPGSVISGIGALLAAVAALGAAIFGFIWFPVKRLVRRLRNRKSSQQVSTESQQGESST